ncbi:MAG: FkbM family methyltransferase [Planctomycetaceae bacterium]
MLKAVKSTIYRLLQWTPYEVRRRLPSSSFEAVRLAIAYHACRNPTGIILQVGAFDGRSGDPLAAFLRQGRAKAILVEPIDEHFRMLQRTYDGVEGITFVQAAIARNDGEATMYRATTAGRWRGDPWVGQIASFDRRHLLKHGVRRDEIEEVAVPALSVASVLARCGVESVAFVQVDAEGFDAEVVGMALDLPVPPNFINFERLHLGVGQVTDICRKLERHGYGFIHGRCDTLAIHGRVAADGDH